MGRLVVALVLVGAASMHSCINSATPDRSWLSGRLGGEELKAEASGLAAPAAWAPVEAALQAKAETDPATASLDSAGSALAASAKRSASCPAGMIFVSGMYCPEVEHRCLRWMESSGKFAYYRCAEYARPAKCLSQQRREMHFCMDRDEYVPAGESLPIQNASWTHAHQTCTSIGKRVCMESEWQFACEGEEMRPYPYGFTRDADACNADRLDIYRADGQLRDLRDGPEGHPKCVSPFGVHHLSGNLEEWTTIDASGPPRPAMKGAYWQPSKNHCRAAQTAHDRYYHGTQTGFRCCKDG